MSGRGCCRALRCDKAIAPTMVMCAAHWWKVPKELRFDIWAYYRAERGSAKHLAAIQKAVDAVAKLEAA